MRARDASGRRWMTDDKPRDEYACEYARQQRKLRDTPQLSAS